MEPVLEKLPDTHSSTDSVKLNEANYQTTSFQEEVNLKSNGIADLENVVNSEPSSVIICTEKSDLNEDTGSVIQSVVKDSFNTESCEESTQTVEKSIEVSETEHMPVETVSAPTDEIKNVENVNSVYINLELPSEATSLTASVDMPIKDSNISEVQSEEVVLETPNESLEGDNVRFETEVVVETNDINEVELTEMKLQDSAHNILDEMNQTIEFSEVLCTSDVTDNVENNNCSIRQEMFNKEELLDILEGNDVQGMEHQILQVNQIENKGKETEIALKQLTRLKKTRRPRTKEVIMQTQVPKNRNITEVKDVQVSDHRVKEVLQNSKRKEMGLALEQLTRLKKARKPHSSEVMQSQTPKNKNKTKKVEETNKDDNIVNALVKDWDDEMEEGDSFNDKDVSTSTSEQLLESSASAIKEEKRCSIDSATSDGQTSAANKSADDGQPQRRLGRVIKKKVIFDPDNPDTFTKGKAYIKSREPQIDKDQPPSKKGKIEPIMQRGKSKSPVSKMQWKKPSSKNSKQNKRLTEVDKLLMDEGAVNMIYQLTPEAPKGKKNMRTKAEFIKKLQSSTPESKEMKFRERKKDSKGEDGEPKKILSGKQRTSLSSSVKSPSVCEEFETHSADDSIIYRRHSSSSYSSSCMSPRRLSDVEASINPNASTSLQGGSKLQLEPESIPLDDGDIQQTPVKDIINKDDCLSIKKKLNSKLSLALNKRKRDSIKTDKPLKKQTKLNDTGDVTKSGYFKYLSLKVDGRVAGIFIKDTNAKLGVEIMKEFIEVLSYVDLRPDTSVTLITLEGGMCSELDMKPLLGTDIEATIKAANDIAESVRYVNKYMDCLSYSNRLGWANKKISTSNLVLSEIYSY
ncbi:unnamed protein product [Diatraea saccharalis]|uniref:Uncharacterized protein n=1 Tax=Diatraea saccharalis TaxID=40085 RepID=A0A9P0CCK5_9NEOP|nr:unnamed protein product [Diatraea saccharalis]